MISLPMLNARTQTGNEATTRGDSNMTYVNSVPRCATRSLIQGIFAVWDQLNRHKLR